MPSPAEDAGENLPIAHEIARKCGPMRHFATAAIMLAMSFAGLPRDAALAQNRQGASPAQLSPPTGIAASGIAATGLHLIDFEPGGKNDSAALIVDLAEETGFRIAALVQPARLVIDLDRTVFQSGAARSGNQAVGPVSGFRSGLFLAGQSRIVIDLVRPALVERADFVRQAGMARLVLQIRTVPEPAFTERVAADTALRLARRPPADPPPSPRTDPQPLVVIDPGHGGIDPGASGVRGEMEKDVVLAFARDLRDRLTAAGRVAVALTREEDVFVPLGQRVAFARSRGAALFVSLHADSLSGETDVRGASVYTLAERASDAEAERAAEKENRADLVAGLEQDEEARGGVESILGDLARRETRAFAQVAARNAVSAIRHVARLHKKPLRSAGFRVLRAPDIPSILIELGYLSNLEDVAALTEAASRARIVEKLAEAIEKFAQAEQETGAAATQPP